MLKYCNSQIVNLFKNAPTIALRKVTEEKFIPHLHTFRESSKIVSSMMATRGEEFTWDISQVFHPKQPYAFVILNHSIDELTANRTRKLWSNATVRVCVDGGTNQFHRLIRGCSTAAVEAANNSPLTTRDNTSASHNNDCVDNDVSRTLEDCKYSDVPLPDFISGDFDSVEKDLLDNYRNMKVKICPTPDQNETDFTKALMELTRHLLESSKDIGLVLVACGVGSDRFDHVLSNINTLHSCGDVISVPVMLLTGNSVQFLLSAGRHKLIPPGHSCPGDNWCAYVPCTGPTTVTTTGLKWDVVDALMQFGSFISTSNQFTGEAVVTTDKPLLFLSNGPPCGEANQ